MLFDCFDSLKALFLQVSSHHWAVILHESNVNLIARLRWTPAEALCSLIFTLG